MVDQEYLNDEKVQKIDADIRNFRVQLQKGKMDLEGLDARLDADIQQKAADVRMKSDVFQTVKARLTQAEDDLKEAQRSHKESRKAKDKARSELKKQVERIGQRIRDAEKAREKRFKELDKEREKLVEKAKLEKAREMEEMKAREMERVEEEKRRELGLGQ
jgi:hypothetical protein